MKDTPKTAIIYVSLGERVSPTLADFAKIASDRLRAECFLITDRPDLWQHRFPGQVKEYQSSDRFRILRLLRLLYPRKWLLDGGFWMATLERIFALAEAEDWLDPGTEVLHFESDVMSLLLPQDLDVLRLHCTLMAVPAESKNAGCASVLFAPSISVLIEGLANLAQIVKNKKTWLSDMQLLALGIQEGFVQELPTYPQKAWGLAGKGTDKRDSESLVFDATALGMFLFGVDPIHSGGTIYRGYRQQDFDWDAFVGNWVIRRTPSGKAERLIFECANGESVAIANLHIHSKINPGELMSSNQTWRTALDESRRGFVDLSRTVSGTETSGMFASRLATLRKLPMLTGILILLGKALRFLRLWR